MYKHTVCALINPSVLLIKVQLVWLWAAQWKTHSLRTTFFRMVWSTFQLGWLLIENNIFFNYQIEPGYYKAGDFGIRIESILRVIPTTFSVNQYCCFEILFFQAIWFTIDICVFVDGIPRSIFPLPGCYFGAFWTETDWRYDAEWWPGNQAEHLEKRAIFTFKKYILCDILTDWLR